MDSGKDSNQKQDQQGSGGNPIKNFVEGAKAHVQHHQANPGPAIPKDFNVQEEGTKEERRAKAEELNK